MVGNAHLDPVWLWPWQEGYQEARATFWSVIHRMEEYDDFIFTCNQVVLISWVEEADPALFAEIRRRVEEGRWIFTGGWWVEPDCNMPDAESFVRQGLHGQRYLRSRFGITATTGMNVDPFGHNAMLPAILQGQGMDSYCFLRPGAHESDMPYTLFWWESADGSRILAYRIPFEYASGAGDVAGQTDKSLAEVRTAEGHTMVFFGVGNHGGGPTRANIDSIHRYDKMGTYGQLLMSSPPKYFRNIREQLGPEGLEALPVWRGDLQHHAAGCYSSHSGIKRWQRRAQAAVQIAERWATLNHVLAGLPHPAQELQQAWKLVLFNQFHDILPGSALEHAYEDARDQLGEAISISKRITTLAHNRIARDVDIPFEEGTQPLLVFNPHPWPVTETMELQHGMGSGIGVVNQENTPVPYQEIRAEVTTDDPRRRAIAFQAALPALSHRLFRLRPDRTTDPLPQTVDEDITLENDILRVVIDPHSGWLTSLCDKRTGVDLTANTTGPHTQICEDPTDTWGHRVVSYAWPGAEMHTTRVTMLERGPVRSRVRIERSWHRSTLVEDIILDACSDAIEVRAELDWREPAHLLKLRAPVALMDARTHFDVPFGAIERPIDGAEEPAQSWVDITGITTHGVPAGLAVIVDAKHGFDCSPTSSIGFTAVRSPIYAWHDPRPLEKGADYSFQDQGIQRFRYLLVPHAGDWRSANLAQRSLQLRLRPRAMLEGSHTGSLPPEASHLTCESESVIVTAIKASEDTAADGSHHLVLRANETQGQETEAQFDLPGLSRTFKTRFSPFQVRTWLIPTNPSHTIQEVNLLEYPVNFA